MKATKIKETMRAFVETLLRVLSWIVTHVEIVDRMITFNYNGHKFQYRPNIA